MKALKKYPNLSLRLLLRRLKKSFLKAYRKRKLSKYYTDIEDIPAYKWFNLYDNNDLSQLLKKGKLCNFSLEAYSILNNQLIDEFGVSENYLQIIKNNIKIEILRIECLLKDNLTGEMEIEILEIDNKSLKSSYSKSDISATVLFFEEKGIKRNEKEISLKEFYKIQDYLYKKALKNG